MYHIFYYRVDDDDGVSLYLDGCDIKIEEGEIRQ